MSWIDIKPEAPWIRRTDQGVVFTDEVVGYDIELPKSESQPSEEEVEQHVPEGGSNRRSDNILDRAIYQDDDYEEE